MFSEAILFRSSEHFHMVLRVVKGLSLHTIHSAFSLSKFEVLAMNNEGDLSPRKSSARRRRSTRLWRSTAGWWSSSPA